MKCRFHRRKLDNDVKADFVVETEKIGPVFFCVLCSHSDSFFFVDFPTDKKHSTWFLTGTQEKRKRFSVPLKRPQGAVWRPALSLAALSPRWPSQAPAQAPDDGTGAGSGGSWEPHQGAPSKAAHGRPSQS